MIINIILNKYLLQFNWNNFPNRWQQFGSKSVVSKVAYTIDPLFNDDCYGLCKDNNRVAVKFTHHKDSKQIFKYQKELRDLNK